MLSKSNWTLEFSQAFKNLRELYAFLDWPLREDTARVANKYPLFIPKRVAQKIKTLGPDSALAREFLPHTDESESAGLIDPIGDKKYLRAPQLIHRYPSRALFTATSICPVHCRYCFRKNELDAKDELFDQDFAQTLAYLRAHPEITEIILTGGDPLTLSNEKLKHYLMGLSEIRSIRDVRFHTRYPVILPSRIDDGFLTLLDETSVHFRTISLAIHANHVEEFDAEVEDAIRKLHHSPIQLLSQTVLLKSVNDDVSSLRDLIERFMDLKIRPYYLHHPDQVQGGMHFYVPLEEGRKIYGHLRSLLPGWAIPQYVIDVPGGHGKVPAFNPEAAHYSGTLLSLDGSPVSINEPT